MKNFKSSQDSESIKETNHEISSLFHWPTDWFHTVFQINTREFEVYLHNQRDGFVEIM